MLICHYTLLYQEIVIFFLFRNPTVIQRIYDTFGTCIYILSRDLLDQPTSKCNNSQHVKKMLRVGFKSTTALTRQTALIGNY